MNKVRVFWKRFADIFRRDRRDQDLAAELESHVAMHIDDNLRAGLSPEEARRQALLKLGGIDQTKESYRDHRGVPWLDSLGQDVRFGLRMLRRNPGFTTVAALTLALGIGASVAIFAFVDAALIKPLPYERPSRLVDLFESNQTGPQFHLSYLDYLDWKSRSRSFSSMAVYRQEPDLLTTDHGTEQAAGARISDGFFRTIGVNPILGRDFYDGEDVASGSSSVLLSYASWQTRFDKSPDVIGQTLDLNGTSARIIGVLPKDFSFAPVGAAEFWLPIVTSDACAQNRGCHPLIGVARLKDGVSVASAFEEVKTIAQNLEKQYPNTNRNRGATLVPLADVVVGNIRPVLVVLLSGAGLLLLIAAVNVASLVIVRSESRKREISVQMALGATPARLVRKFVTEGLLLSIPGNVLGLLVAYVAIGALRSLIPVDRLASMPSLESVGINLHVILFASIVSVVSGILFSLLPVLRLSLLNVEEGLNESGRSVAGTVWRRVGSKLVSVELATAVVLLVAAGLLGKSSYLLLTVDTGFRPQNLAAVGVSAQAAGYQDPAKDIEFERQVLAAIEALPGVESAGTSSYLPIGTGDGLATVGVVGNPNLGNNNEVNDRKVSSTYFSTVGARLLRGRYFAETDDLSRTPVIIVNETLVRRLFSNVDPLGQHIMLPQAKAPLEIVGIISDIKEGPLDMAPRPAYYQPFNQNPDNEFFVVGRTSGSPELLLEAMVQAIHKIDPDVATYSLTTMTDRIHDSPSAYLHRSAAWLIGGFALTALILGAIGLYGVIAYSVGQRTWEIGIRMALGADRGAVWGMVMREAVRLAGAGISIGVAVSLAGGMLLRGLLFGVRVWDPSTLAGVCLLLCASALLACWLPARRAMRVDPVSAMRHE